MNITELLTDLASNTNAIIRSIASRFNLTTSQAFNLLLIPFDGIPISNLAYKLGLDNSTLTRNIQKLEKLGLVNREPDKYDKRVQRVVLTKNGMSLVKSLSEDLDDQGSNILDNIDLDTQEHMLTVLEKLTWALSCEREKS
jgi:DNA-binding MarR family transcriptional regulator